MNSSRSVLEVPHYPVPVDRDADDDSSCFPVVVLVRVGSAILVGLLDFRGQLGSRSSSSRILSLSPALHCEHESVQHAMMAWG
jgi:hypothetical protein